MESMVLDLSIGLQGCVNDSAALKQVRDEGSYP